MQTVRLARDAVPHSRPTTRRASARAASCLTRQGDKTEIPPVSPSSPGRARRKLTLASAVAAIGAILLGGLWFGNRRGQQPADAEAHYNLGVALKAQGKLEEAIAEFRAAIRLKPDYAEAHSNLGIALRAQGKLEEAIAEYRAAIRLKPDNAEAHDNLGIALEDQGKLEEAVAEIPQGPR